jgi:hypothetical protein
MIVNKDGFKLGLKYPLFSRYYGDMVRLYRLIGVIVPFPSIHCEGKIKHLLFIERGLGCYLQAD